MNNCEISIIIPVYNAEKYITKCIKSIQEQSFKDYELILINDGSTDKTLDVIQKMGKLPQKTKIITIKNSGVGVARNTGLQYAMGNYITFIDSDDYIEKDYLESLYQNATKYKADIAAGNFFYVRNNEKIKNNLIRTGMIEKIDSKTLYQYFFENIGASVWAKLYKKEFIKNQKFSTAKMGEDLFFNLRGILSNKSCKIYIFDKPIYDYMDNMNSSSYKKNLSLIEDWKKEIQLIETTNQYEEKIILDTLVMQVYRLYNEHVHYAIITKEYQYKDIYETLKELIKEKKIVELAQKGIKGKSYTMVQNPIKRYIFRKTICLIGRKKIKSLVLLTILKIKLQKR